MWNTCKCNVNVVLVVFFYLRKLFIMSLFHRIKTFYSKEFRQCLRNAYQKKRWKEKQDLDAESWHRACTHVSPNLWIVCKIWNYFHSLVILLSIFKHLFFVLQRWNSCSKVRRSCITRPEHNSSKQIPELEKRRGEWRGWFRRRQVFLMQ